MMVDGHPDGSGFVWVLENAASQRLKDGLFALEFALASFSSRP
jgi:hypothetical protein